MKTSTILFAATLVLAGCQAEPPAQQDVRTPVKVCEVQHRAVAKPIRTSGRLATDAEILLSFKIGGIVDHIHFREGANVDKGSVLAQLKMDEIEAQVAQAQSGYEKAKRDLERAKNLHAENIVTLEQLQNAQTAVKMAESSLQIARFNRDHAQITAPANGRILNRMVQQDEMIGPGVPVIQFGASAGGWIVETGLAGRDIMNISLGDTARVRFDERPGQRYIAVVQSVAGGPHPRSGLYNIECRLINPDAGLKNGFIAHIELLPSAQEQCTLVPINALVDADGSLGSVFRINADSVARKVQVTVRFLIAEQAALRYQPELTRIVTDGAPYLRDGSLVNIIE
ncbi:efflux RND transporter periplasmic adaptor subunit [candidate division KSB1 bacterium]|nr:efflux RND transporter periplasmic adaptor subunit [candidate division KSB1 bacterium]